MDEKIKVLMKVSDIPIGSTVIKKTGEKGEKEYRVKDSLMIYAVNKGNQEIRSEGGSRFLIDSNGDASVIDGSVEMLWVVRIRDLYDFLDECINGEEER